MLDDVLRQVKQLVVGDGDAARLAGGTALLVNHKTALLQRSNDHARLQVRKFWRHPSLDSDS